MNDNYISVEALDRFMETGFEQHVYRIRFMGSMLDWDAAEESIRKEHEESKPRYVRHYVEGEEP